jgi:hypothetical protein
MAVQTFDREEVQFTHDDEDFVYYFNRFESKKITFKQLKPLGPIPEVDIYPSGTPQLANTAIIILFKAATSGHQPLKGILPDILRTMLDLYSTKDTMVANLSKTIFSFRAKKPIAIIEDVVQFVEPYASWKVKMLSDVVRLMVESKQEACHLECDRAKLRLSFNADSEETI